VLGAQDLLTDGEQRGGLVAGPGRVARLPGPAREVGAGGQGVAMPGAEVGRFGVCLGDLLEQVQGGAVGAAMTQVQADTPDAGAGQVEDCKGMWQQRPLVRNQPPPATPC